MVRANSANATTKRPAERCGCCCGTGGELHLLHEDHRVLVRLDAPLAPGLGDHCRHAGPTYPPSPALQGHAAARSLTHALHCAVDGQQLATFLFYSVTAYKFRPMSANPYLRISQEDEEELRQLVRRSPTRPGPLEPSFFLNLEHSPLTCSWTFGGAGNGADRDGARDKRPVMRALPSVCCVGAVNSFF